MAGSVLFTAVKYSLNPGLSTFTWLSKQAAGWEQYHFRYLHFRFVPRVASTTAGSLILAPDYDPNDAPPASEIAVSSYRDCVEGNSWVNFSCKLDPLAMYPIGPRKYVRDGLAIGTLKVFDVGNLFACTVGQADTTVIGKLWADYDIDFFVPQTVSAIASETISYYNLAAAQVLVNNTNTNVAWAVVVDPVGFGTPVAGSFATPKGAYLISGVLNINPVNAPVLVDTTYQMLTGGGAPTPVMSIQNIMSIAVASCYYQIPFCFYAVTLGAAVTFQINITDGTGNVEVLPTSSLSVRVA